MDDPARAARPVAVLTLVGFINIPIIKFSVDWWNTLHQPASVIRMDGPTIHPSMLYPLLVMAIAYTLIFFTLHLMAMRNEIWRTAGADDAPPGRAIHRPGCVKGPN
jgi:heme exporter protein C